MGISDGRKTGSLLNETGVTYERPWTRNGVAAVTAGIAGRSGTYFESTNSVVFLSAATMNTQHELFTAVASCCPDMSELSSHPAHEAGFDATMGQEATTIGNPTLNTRKIAAATEVRIRYFDESFMRSSVTHCSFRQQLCQEKIANSWGNVKKSFHD